jgi:hypothetical protein
MITGHSNKEGKKKGKNKKTKFQVSGANSCISTKTKYLQQTQTKDIHNLQLVLANLLAPLHLIFFTSAPTTN